MSDKPRLDTTRLQKIAQAYWESAALMAAVELDLFTAIAHGHDTIPALARAIDVSERKWMEEEMCAAYLRFESVIQNTPNIAIQGYSLDGKVLEWNHASEVLYGYSKHEVLGTAFKEGLKDGDVVDVLQDGYMLGERVLRPALVAVSKSSKTPSANDNSEPPTVV